MFKRSDGSKKYRIPGIVKMVLFWWFITRENFISTFSLNILIKLFTILTTILTTLFFWTDKYILTPLIYLIGLTLLNVLKILLLLLTISWNSCSYILNNCLIPFIKFCRIRLTDFFMDTFIPWCFDMIDLNERIKFYTHDNHWFFLTSLLLFFVYTVLPKKWVYRIRPHYAWYYKKGKLDDFCLGDLDYLKWSHEKQLRNWDIWAKWDEEWEEKQKKKREIRRKKAWKKRKKAWKKKLKEEARERKCKERRKKIIKFLKAVFL